MQTYCKIKTNICPRCGKMDNQAICSQCRYCSAYLDEDGGFDPRRDE